MTQMDQQTHIVSGQQQPVQQQHIITKHLNNASAIVQKVIPRNILVSTSRIQNKIEVGFPFVDNRSFLFTLVFWYSSRQQLHEHQRPLQRIKQIRYQTLSRSRSRTQLLLTKRIV